MSDVVAVGFDWKIVKVDAAENDTGVRRSREEPDVGVDASVETHTLSFNRAVDGGLKHRAT